MFVCSCFSSLSVSPTDWSLLPEYSLPNPLSSSPLPVTKENAKTVSYSLMQLVRPDTAVSNSPFCARAAPVSPPAPAAGVNLQAVVEVLTSRLAETQSVPTKVAVLKWFRHLEEQLPEAVSGPLSGCVVMGVTCGFGVTYIEGFE